MAPPRALPAEIDQALARGWTIITANQRAARTLRLLFDRGRHTRGLPSWQPPPIFAWETWLNLLWRQLLLDGHASALLLNSTQEHTLWRDLIAADLNQNAGSPDIRPLDSFAQLAAQAWLLLHAYHGRQRLRSASATADTRAFERWATDFDRRLTRANFLTSAQLPEALRSSVRAGDLTTPPGILLVGFDTQTPAQTALLEALASAGTAVELQSPQQPAHEPALVQASSEPEELLACAHWLRAHLSAHPTSRLAVIVPDLEAARPETDRTFRTVLAPELEDITAPLTSGPFEFSLGIPLAHTPIVAAALDILRWATGPLPLDRVSTLLLSPWFAAPSGTEATARAEFDAFTLRRHAFLQPRIPLDQLLSIVSGAKSSAALPNLLKHLRALRPLFSNAALTTAQDTAAHWIAVIQQILEAAGLSVRSGESSLDFQTRRRWESALDELATLDFEGRRMPFAAALSALQRIAAQTLFAPESHHASIQIMGPLESAGSEFDAIWFLRAGDLTWPVPSAPHPLLPWPLQRELSMPGTDPGLESALARRTAERIVRSAPTLHFSYAQQTREATQRPSPVLATLALTPISAHTFIPDEPAEPLVLTSVADLPPSPPPAGQTLGGGATILQLQAACGFRAFAEKRLFSSTLESRELGLDPRERGDLVHVALEHFWSQVRTQAELAALPALERETRLSESIDHALADHQAYGAPAWNHAYLQSERQRLLNLLRPWLEYEITRPAFEVKSREEVRKDVQIGPLQLNIRVDRIDTLLLEGEPAGDVILDYKTGPAKPADWLGDRPDAPQLPLYAVLSDPAQLAGVAFASIRPGTGLDLTGYQAHPGVLLKASRLKTSSLEAQVDEWRETLTSLANDFYAGNAVAAPKQYPATCRHCEQRLLCRLDLATLQADANEEFALDTDTGNNIPEAELV